MHGTLIRLFGDFFFFIFSSYEEIFLSLRKKNKNNNNLILSRFALSISSYIRTRYCGIGDEKIGMNWNFVRHRLAITAIGFGAAESDATIQAITLTSLDEEQLRFASQCGASRCSEKTPDIFELVMRIFGINVTQFTVRQNRYQ